MKTVGSFLSFAALASAVCHYGTTLAPRDSLVGRAEGKFGYDGLQGPINWHGLSPSNALCARGKSQSPVNIVPSDYDTVSGSSYNLEIPSYPDGAEIENLGTGVQVYVNGSAIVGDTTYALQQYHFHTPSEHRIGSEYYPMEVHFVMQANGRCRPSLTTGPGVAC
jgi:carbonic anhydrase